MRFIETVATYAHRTITIVKAPVSTVVLRRLFTNNLSQLFQINPMHAYRWPNGGPVRARCPRATALAQTCHMPAC
jgi:hypothetical protein